MTHNMLPEATHDEAVQQLFVRDLKTYLGDEIAQLHRARAERLESGTRANYPLPVVYRALHGDERSVPGSPCAAHRRK